MDDNNLYRHFEIIIETSSEEQELGDLRRKVTGLEESSFKPLASAESLSDSPLDS
jgi:hypothetical protein